MKIIKGKNVNEKLESVDLALTRMMRRANKTVVGLVSPVPVSTYADEIKDTPMLRFMFPGKGAVSDILIYVEEMPKEGAQFIATLYSKDSIISKSATSKKQAMRVNAILDTVGGDRIEVSAKAINKEEVVKGIWIAFLWMPEVSYTKSLKFLINELEKELDKVNEVAETTEAPEEVKEVI